jgi:subtilisin
MARVSHVVTFSLVVALTLATMAVLVQPLPGVAKGRPTGAVPDQFIVRLKPGVDPASKLDKVKRGGGVESTQLYRRTINGFAARINPKKVDELRADPDVLSIAPDFYVSVAAETTPTGIQRTDANLNAFTSIDRNPTGVVVDAGVAIVDTGIDLDHPDLNVAGGVNCATDGTSPEDLNGHGTHVAGTVGALDNDLGVVGVAPGARLYAVRVLNAAGEGEFSNVICGMEWILGHTAEVDVVNMSFGGPAPEGDCNDGSLHEAVCDVIDAGITVVVAAGNGGADAVGDDAAESAPANFDEVITVSAIVDTDGKPGGADFGHFFWGPDDSLALFSNWGADVDIAAPGVNIYSAWPGGYQNSDGTSMASPHVAGAAALVRAMNPGVSPATVRAEILAVAWPQSSPQGFTGDTDGHPEPLLNVGALGGDPLPPLPPTPPPPASCTIDPQVAAPSTQMNIACVGFQPGEFVRAYWGSTSGASLGLFFADQTGSGTLKPRVPLTSAGVYDVIVVGGTSGKQATLPFTVVTSISVTPEPLAAGKSGTVKLAGFLPREPITVTLSNETGSIDLLAATAGSAGSLLKGFTVPQTPRGTYSVVATGATSGETATTQVIIDPSLKVSPASIRVGSNVKLTFAGFLPNEQISINWYDDDVVTSFGSVTASSAGSASASFMTPPTVTGDHIVEAVGSQGTTVSGIVKILPAVAVTESTIKVGNTATVTLTGYGANEVVTIDWYDTTADVTTIGTVTVGANGSETFSFIVPDATYGSHRVRGVSASSGPSVYDMVTVLPDVVLSPVSGSSGTQVTASLTGFKASETVTIRWYQTSTVFTALTSTPVSAAGSGTVAFTVPNNQTLGKHKVTGYGVTSRVQATSSFTVQ